ncbi:MAG: succinate dehydrogenase/fumarate reductase flavoprotein subunit, partial [Candidatus Acidiferrales bacterium]
NRLGSNSLPELLVFGARAGRAAAEFASSAHPSPNGAITAQARDEKRRLEDQMLGKNGSAKRNERIAALREEMQKTMEQSAGIYRHGASLQQAAGKLRELQARCQNLVLEDRSRTFNTELPAALELGFMLDVAESMVACALHRTESRGAHQRTDFPGRDDERFLAHSLVSRTADGTPRVHYQPVVITRWPPGERVYGEQAKGARVK